MEMKQTNKPRSKRGLRIVIWTLSILVIITVAASVLLDSLTYKPLDEAKAVFLSDTKVVVEHLKDGYRFEPVGGEAIQPDIIFIRVDWCPKVMRLLPREWRRRGTAYTLHPCL